MLFSFCNAFVFFNLNFIFFFYLNHLSLHKTQLSVVPGIEVVYGLH